MKCNYKARMPVKIEIPPKQMIMMILHDIRLTLIEHCKITDRPDKHAALAVLTMLDEGWDLTLDEINKKLRAFDDWENVPSEIRRLLRDLDLYVEPPKYRVLTPLDFIPLDAKQINPYLMLKVNK